MPRAARGRHLAGATVWWLANIVVGYVLGGSFQTATSGDVAFTAVGLVPWVAAAAIIVCTIMLAAWLGVRRRIALSLTLLSGPPFLVAGWLIATWA